MIIKLNTSLPANTIMAKLTNHVQRTRFITSLTDKHYSLDSEDDFRSGCRNVSHQQQFFSELPSPGRSHYTNYYYRLQCKYCLMLISLRL